VQKRTVGAEKQVKSSRYRAPIIRCGGLEFDLVAGFFLIE
jgi:hypothetical protein